MINTISSFAPIEPGKNKSRILILGSMPGEESLRQQEYYAHARNAFWWIIGEILQTDLVTTSYKVRVQTVKKNGIALWDTLANCRRSGSLDSNIEKNSIQVNDIGTLLKRQQQIRLIAFNGKKSAHLFTQHIMPSLSTQYTYTTLPSTSPAHASMRREEKLRQWRQALLPYLPSKELMH